MTGLNPYLHFMGNTEAAMNFYKSVFGGEFTIFQRFKDIAGGEKMSPEDQQKIIHISLPIGKGNVIMATDSLESMGQSLVSGNNFHIYIHAESEKEVDKLFNALSAGGSIEMPVNKTFWGAYFGMCMDKFGIQWMISFEKK
ncbi:MAG: VOC family protein [Bacteroidota bacterium]